MTAVEQAQLGVATITLIREEVTSSWAIAREPHGTCTSIQCLICKPFGIPCRAELWRRQQEAEQRRGPLISRDELNPRCFVDPSCVVEVPPGRVMPFGPPAVPPQTWERLAALKDKYAFASLFGRLEPLATRRCGRYSTTSRRCSWRSNAAGSLPLTTFHRSKIHRGRVFRDDLMLIPRSTLLLLASQNGQLDCIVLITSPTIW
jgi:hypothetical protein